MPQDIAPRDLVAWCAIPLLKFQHRLYINWNGLIFIDSFTMQTLSIHCILNFFDLFGFLRHYLLNLIGLPHSMSNVDHCRSIPIKFALLIPMLIKKDQHFFMTLQSLLTSFVPLPKLFFYCRSTKVRVLFNIANFALFTNSQN